MSEIYDKKAYDLALEALKDALVHHGYDEDADLRLLEELGLGKKLTEFIFEIQDSLSVSVLVPLNQTPEVVFM